MIKFIVSFLGMLGIAATLAAATPQAASAQPHMDHHRCPRGSHWVPPHRNRQGRWVQGHCAPRR